MNATIRQGLSFIVIGLIQLALDTAIFSFLQWTTGATGLANLAGRVTGASLGFYLNGRYTFLAQDGSRQLKGRNLRRFLIAWICLTSISTLAMLAIAHWLPAHYVYWLKPVVEAVLAGVSFFISRHWVYR